MMIDLTDHVPPRFINSRKPIRPLSQITGVTLHQTGCFYTPGKLDGWKRLNAHIGIPRSGPWLLVNGFEKFIWHAQGLSASTIGIEVEGKLPGLIGNTKTIWQYQEGDPITLTESQKVGLIEALDFCFSKVGVGTLWAHRQSFKNRTLDPGEEIWKLASQWAFGLHPGRVRMEPDKTLGSGKPIPKEWRI
jgi:hypothetical protein